MDFDDLQALLWVHERGSLQSASRATGVSRAALRRRLEKLDAAVGRPTHVTGPEGITLTAAGHVLVDEGQALLAARQRLLERAQGMRSPQNTLRVLLQQGLPPRPSGWRPASSALLCPASTSSSSKSPTPRRGWTSPSTPSFTGATPPSCAPASPGWCRP